MRLDRRRRRRLSKPSRWMTAPREHTRLWPWVRTWTDWDWAGAELEWRRALELDPNAANTHAYFAHFLAITGRIDEAVLHSERALELDPFNALFHGLVRGGPVSRSALRRSHCYGPHRAGHAAEHVCCPQRAARIFVRQWNARRVAGQPAGTDRTATPSSWRRSSRASRKPATRARFRRLADILAARLEESGGIVAPGRRAVALYVAKHYLYAGDYDRAMDWLEKAFEVHDPNLPYIGTRSYLRSLALRPALPGPAAPDEPADDRRQVRS